MQGEHICSPQNKNPYKSENGRSPEPQAAYGTQGCTGAVEFIREWWENGDAVTLITRLRSFGKTLNMSMVEQFFSLEYAGMVELFEGLSIWEEKSSEEDSMSDREKSLEEGRNPDGEKSPGGKRILDRQKASDDPAQRNRFTLMYYADCCYCDCFQSK